MPSQHELAKEYQRRYQDALRYLAVLVERAGGEVIILHSDLEVDRRLSKDEIGFTGSVRLKVERP